MAARGVKLVALLTSFVLTFVGILIGSLIFRTSPEEQAHKYGTIWGSDGGGGGVSTIAVDTTVLTPDAATPFSTQFAPGTFVYLYGPDGGMALAADNSTAQSMRSVGVYAAPGVVQTGGAAVAQFTAQGGAPHVGQSACLAHKADDGATGEGKLTATCPPPVIQTWGYDNSDRFNYPRNKVEVFDVTDVSGYRPACDGGACSCAPPATCTAKGIIRPPKYALVPSAARLPPSGTRWITSGLSGFQSSSNYLTAAYNVAGATLNEGDVFIITWDHVRSDAGYSLISNKDGSGNGYDIKYQSFFTGPTFWNANSAVGSWSASTTLGTHRIVVRVHGGQSCMVIDNGSVTCGPTGAMANAASGTLKLGSGTFGPTPGTIWNAAHLVANYDGGAGITDSDMFAWASAVVPQHTTEVNRIMLPESVLQHPALVWSFEPSYYPQPILPANGAVPVFSWSNAGGVAPLSVTTIYRLWTGEDLAALMRGTAWPYVDTQLVPRAAPYSEIAWTSMAQDAGAGLAGFQAAGLLYYQEAFDNSDQIQSGFLSTQDAGFVQYAGRIAPANGSMGWRGEPVFNDRTIKTAWITYDPGVDVPFKSQNVVVTNGGAVEAFYAPGYQAHYGDFLVGLITSDQTVFTSQATVSRALVFVGGNELLGDNCTGSPNPPANFSCSTIAIARRSYPSAGGSGVVHAFVRAGEQGLLPFQAGATAAAPGLLVNGSVRPAAQMVLDHCTHEGATTCDVVIVLDPYWEWVGSSALLSPTNYQAFGGAFVDQIHANCAAAGITCNISWGKGARGSVAGGGANGAGFTYAQFLNAVGALTTGRAWLTVHDLNAPTPITWAGQWIATQTQANNFAANINAHLSLW